MASSALYYRMYRLKHPGMRQEQYRKTIAKKPWQYTLYAIRNRAKELNFPCDLDDAWFAERWFGVCALTRLTFRDGPRNPRKQSVDRINNNLGYLKSNCRLVLLCVNVFKFTSTDSEMLDVAKRLVECLSS